MEENKRVVYNETLNLIIRFIDRSLHKLECRGFVNGKPGVALFYYNYSKIKSNNDLWEKADKILDEIWNESLLSGMPSNFLFGQSGLGWMFQKLMEDSIVAQDSKVEDVLKNFDRNMIYFRLVTPVPIDFKSDLFANGLYLMKRFRQYRKYKEDDGKENFLYRLILQEQLIYLIDDCERILQGKTAFNDYMKPQWSLRLLNSFLYFLIVAHHYGLFPEKTNKLINYALKLSRELMPYAEIIDIADIVTLECLIAGVNPAFKLSGRIELDFARNYMENQICLQPSEVYAILVRAGFYSLIYEDDKIFNSTLYLLSQYNPLCIEDLNKYLDDGRPLRNDLSFDGLSALGYGMLLQNC